MQVKNLWGIVVNSFNYKVLLCYSFSKLPFGIMRIKIIMLRFSEFRYRLTHQLPPKLNKLAFFMGILGCILAVYDFGFHRVDAWQQFVEQAYGFSIILFCSLFVLRLGFHVPPRVSVFLFLAEVALIMLLGFAGYLFFFLQPGEPLTGKIEYSERVYYNLLLIFIFFIELSRNSLGLLRLKFNPPLLFAGSFFFLILVGAGLLMLPRATYTYITFTDAFFTSVSAVCVTGLIVVDTATHFTPFGQVVILFLIQLGGLGVMVFVSFFGFFFQGSHSFQNQLFLKDFVNEENLGKMFRTLAKILTFTFLVQLIGAIALFHSLPAHAMLQHQKVWFSVFHSVSAFCNAGFSIVTDGLYHSGMGIRNNYNMHLLIALLVVAGGIGFPVVLNVYRFVGFYLRNLFEMLLRGGAFHHKPRVINVNSRLAMSTTLVLLLAGTGMFFLLEQGGVLRGMSLTGQAVTSLFGAVTPRTAGFNTVDLNALATPTLLLTIALMWIGASPGSTGGGIKTSTFALAFLNIFSIAKGRNRVEYNGREISADSLHRAFGIIVMSVLVISICIFALTITNPQIPLRAIVFESFSAFSTVGLSLGATPQFNDAGKLILCATMFIGRIGTITLMVAFFRKLVSLSYRYPTEHININ